MQDENNIFSDIPSLGDVEGLNQYMEQQTANQFNENISIPGALQQEQQSDVQTPQENVSQNSQVVYTPEQVQAIVQQVQQQYAAMQQQQQQQQQVTQNTNVQAYTPQELNAINTLLSRGYSLEQVLQAVQSNRARNSSGVNPAVLQKINNIENYLQQQQYQAALTEFTTKMTTFGDKFGLSERDLVVFGNAALAKGINLTEVQDVEMVFKMMYPEQYSIRMQRMSNTPTSQIYGGTSVPETNRALNEKAMDAYVDSFLKRSMPNQYGMQRK